MISVLIAELWSLLREGLCLMLERAGDLTGPKEEFSPILLVQENPVTSGWDVLYNFQADLYLPYK